jgi:hypothetical protein
MPVSQAVTQLRFFENMALKIFDRFLAWMSGLFHLLLFRQGSKDASPRK